MRIMASYDTEIMIDLADCLQAGSVQGRIYFLLVQDTLPIIVSLLYDNAIDQI